MNFINSIKSIFSPRVFYASTVRRLDGSGTKGAQYRPFDYRASLAAFNSWAYSAAQIVAKECATVPIRMYVRSDNTAAKCLYRTRPVSRRTKAYLLGDSKDRPSKSVMRKMVSMGSDFEEVTEPHPALDLLATMSPWMNGFDAQVLKFLYLQLTGNCYWQPVINRQLGVPDQINLLPAQWVEVQPSREEFIKGYVYGSSRENQVVFDKDEVIHFKLPNPDDVYYGMGPMQAAWKAVGLSASKHAMDQAHFDNRGRPDWLLVAKAGVGPDILDRFERQVERKLKGSRKAGKMLAITGDVDIKQLNFDSEAIGDPDRVLDEIAACFGVPRAFLTGNSAVSGGGSEEASTTFLRGTVLPYLRMDEERLNEAYLPLWGIEGDACLAYDNPVPENEQASTDKAVKLTQAAIQTINEARADEGMDEIEGGDVPRFNGVELGKMGNPPPMSVGFGGGTDKPPVKEDKPNGKAMRAITKAIKSLEEKIASGEKFNQENALAFIAGLIGKPNGATGGGSIAKDGTITPHISSKSLIFGKAIAADNVRHDEPLGPEVQLRNAVAKVLKACSVEVQNALIDATNTADPIAAVEAVINGYRGKIAEAVVEPIRAVIEQSGKVALAEAVKAADGIVIDFNVRNPEVEQAVRGFTEQLAGGVTETTVAEVRDTVAQGMADGLPMGKIAEKIRATESYTFSPDRAEMIARSESARGYGQGTIEGWKQSGVVMGKTWLAAPSCCEFCQEVGRMFNGKTIGLDQPFFFKGSAISVGKQTMRLDYSDTLAPPLHPNCLLPGTVVSARGVVSGYAAVYNGQAIELTMANGARLSVTANHMLLTDRGFVAAKSLRNGDNVIHCAGFDGVIPSDPNRDYGPSPIEQVIGSLAVSGGVTARSVPVSPEYLHGDGRFCDGNVDVVTMDGLLGNAIETHKSQHLKNLPLCAGWSSDTLARLGNLDSMLVRMSLAAHRIMGCTCQPASLAGAGVGHANVHRGTTTTLDHADALQATNNHLPTATKDFRQLLDGFSGSMSRCEVVGIKSFNFAGHVYDLQTDSGLYIGNGIVSSNCRCTVQSVLITEPTI